MSAMSSKFPATVRGPGLRQASYAIGHVSRMHRRSTSPSPRSANDATSRRAIEEAHERSSRLPTMPDGRSARPEGAIANERREVKGNTVSQPLLLLTLPSSQTASRQLFARSPFEFSTGTSLRKNAKRVCRLHRFSSLRPTANDRSDGDSPVSPARPPSPRATSSSARRRIRSSRPSGDVFRMGRKKNKKKGAASSSSAGPVAAAGSREGGDGNMPDPRDAAAGDLAHPEEIVLSLEDDDAVPASAVSEETPSRSSPPASPVARLGSDGARDAGAEADDEGDDEEPPSSSRASSFRRRRAASAGDAETSAETRDLRGTDAVLDPGTATPDRPDAEPDPEASPPRSPSRSLAPPPPVPSDPPGSSARSAAPRAARGFPSIPPRTKWSAPSA